MPEQNGTTHVLTEQQAEKILTGEPLTLGYRPSLPINELTMWDGTTYGRILLDIEAMVAHPHVGMCLGVYRSGIAPTRIKITKASSPQVADYAMAEFKRFWLHREKVQHSYEYGWVGLEPMWKVEGGYLKLDRLEDFNPSDTYVLTRRHEYVGVRVKNVEGIGTVNLWGAGKTGGYWQQMEPRRSPMPQWNPDRQTRLIDDRTDAVWISTPKFNMPAKAFWFAHRRRFNRWYGRTQTLGAWRPWRRLSGKDGAETVIDGGVYRFAYRGPVVRYPSRKMQPLEGNTDAGKNNRDKARELAENAKAGVSVALPSEKDEKGGQYLWDMDWPEHVIQVDGLIGYAKYLKDEIAYGTDVPPEILQASDVGSGYSGRAIPMEAFYVGQQSNAEAIVYEWKDQLLDPSITWNFGPEAFVEIEVESILAVKQEAARGVTGQTGVPGGPDQQQQGQGQPQGQPGQGGQNPLAGLLSQLGPQGQKSSGPGISLSTLRYDYASTQFDLPEALVDKIREYAAQIDPADIVLEGGIETEPHITVKYGLHKNEPAAAQSLLAGMGPVQVKLGATSIFSHEDGDVLKLDVYGPAVHELHKRLSQSLANTETWPTFKPHVTIAYLKPGRGKKYVGHEDFDGIALTFDTLTFCGKDGVKTPIDLKGCPCEQQLPPRSEPIELATATASPWTRYAGPHGGKGWKNVVTGKVLYQEKRPGDDEEGHDEEDAPQPKTAPKEPAKSVASKASPASRTSEPAREGFAQVERSEDGSYRQSNGKPLPSAITDRLQAMRLPPAWTGVQIADDPNAPLQVIGYDKKGRQQRVYSAEHAQKAAAEKFLRVKSLVKQLPLLDERIRHTLAGPDGPAKEAAACLLLMRKTGFRIGSDKDTKAEKEARGASTLEAENVSIRGSTVRFAFTGKKGVDIQQEIDDQELASLIAPRIKKGGRLFDTTPERIRDYLRVIDSVFKPKDFRTVVAAETALDAMSHMEAPKDEKQFKKQRLQVAKAVASKLGNTPAVAVQSYIPPLIWRDWESNLEHRSK